MDYEHNLFGEDVLVKREEADASEEEKAGSKFNIFALTDAFAERRKKDAWVLYQKALASGLVAEEVFFKLVWQVKALLLAKHSKSAEEAGMKSFPFNKARLALKKWPDEELEELSLKLALGYHAVRRGEGEMETFVEKTILGI